MRETILAVGIPLSDVENIYTAPEGFERFFCTYDRDSKQIILGFTDKAKDFPRK